MNINLTRDEFHEVVMLYLVYIARENRDALREGQGVQDAQNTPDGEEGVVFSEEFDNFLSHILSRPLGDLKTVYFRSSPKIKLSFKRMAKKMDEVNEEVDSGGDGKFVRIII